MFLYVQFLMIKLDEIFLELYQKVSDGNLLFWLSVSVVIIILF